jgi:hypothetical protein
LLSKAHIGARRNIHIPRLYCDYNNGIIELSGGAGSVDGRRSDDVVIHMRDEDYSRDVTNGGPVAPSLDEPNDWTETSSPSVSLVHALAAVGDEPLHELPPLQHLFDVDALDTLLSTAAASGADVSVSFAYEGIEVSVASDGTVRIEGESGER